MPKFVITDDERRLLANLSIPRNVSDLTHELRIDPGSQTRSEEVVSEELLEAQKQGWVVKLGEFADPVKSARAVEKNKNALKMPDEQAKIYSERMSSPIRAWRMDGDLWILTNDGLEALKAPAVDSPAMTPSQVQTVIDQEWNRTLKGVTAQDYDYDAHGTLTNQLLEEEFTEWANTVADETERVWNQRPRLPMAGGAGWTDTYENYILDHENQKTSLATNDTITGTWYMALVIVALTDTDTGTTAGDGTRGPTYTGYARKSVAAADMAAAAAGSSSNSNAIIFAACTSGSSAIVGFGNCAASTAGLLKKYGTCTSTTVSTTQTPAQFAAGAYTTTAD